MGIDKDIPYIDSRLFKILLMCVEKKLCSIDTITEELNVTSRSVRTYIKQLNEELGKDVAVINHIKGAGYKLEIFDEERLEKIIDRNRDGSLNLNSREDRVKYILNYLTELEGTITLDELADEMCIGRTTLVNDFKVVKKLLKSYNLTLINRQNIGMRLEEDELNIRLFILNYLYKESNINFRKSKYFYVMNDEKIKKIENMLLYLFKEYKYYATDEVLRDTINYIVLMFYRNRIDKRIDVYEKRSEILISYSEYELAEKIIESLESEFNYKFDKSEKIFITLPLVSSNAPMTENAMKYSQNIRELIDNIIYEIHIKTGLFIEDEELREGLGYHLKYTLNRLLFNINIKNILLDEIKEKYTLPYNMGIIAASVIEKEYNVSVSEDEIGYIALHFGSYLERTNDRLNSIRKIALICGTGLGTSRLLNIRLRKMLGEDILIKNFSSIHIDEQNFDEYDLILTTINIKISTKTLVIKIDTIFDENKLKSQIDSLIHLEGAKLDMSIPTNLITQIISNPEQFMVLQEDNIMDCLNVMLDNLNDFGYTDDTFKSRVIKRELHTPTAFDNGMLLPHSFCDGIDTMGLAIGILDKPIIYNNKTIKLILLMIMPPEDKMDSDLLVKIYDEILRIGQNSKIINKLCKCRSLNDVRGVIFEGCI